MAPDLGISFTTEKPVHSLLEVFFLLRIIRTPFSDASFALLSFPLLPFLQQKSPVETTSYRREFTGGVSGPLFKVGTGLPVSEGQFLLPTRFPLQYPLQFIQGSGTMSSSPGKRYRSFLKQMAVLKEGFHSCITSTWKSGISRHDDEWSKTLFESPQKGWICLVQGMSQISPTLLMLLY